MRCVRVRCVAVRLADASPRLVGRGRWRVGERRVEDLRALLGLACAAVAPDGCLVGWSVRARAGAGGAVEVRLWPCSVPSDDLDAAMQAAAGPT